MLLLVCITFQLYITGRWGVSGGVTERERLGKAKCDMARLA